MVCSFPVFPDMCRNTESSCGEIVLKICVREPELEKKVCLVKLNRVFLPPGEYRTLGLNEYFTTHSISLNSQ